MIIDILIAILSLGLAWGVATERMTYDTKNNTKEKWVVVFLWMTIAAEILSEVGMKWFPTS